MASCLIQHSKFHLVLTFSIQAAFGVYISLIPFSRVKVGEMQVCHISGFCEAPAALNPVTCAAFIQLSELRGGKWYGKKDDERHFSVVVETFFKEWNYISCLVKLNICVQVAWQCKKRLWKAFLIRQLPSIFQLTFSWQAIHTTKNQATKEKNFIEAHWSFTFEREKGWKMWWRWNTRVQIQGIQNRWICWCSLQHIPRDVLVQEKCKIIVERWMW